MIPRSASNPPHIVLSCGEASGERYGVALARALRAACPEVRLSGMGGAALADDGVDLAVRADDLAVMGFTGVLAALPRILDARRRIKEHATAPDVDLVVPVDFPGFNLGLASHARSRGKPVYYLVAPQLWAWGGWRAKKLKRSVDRLGTLLPFEASFFEARGITCDRLGHPLMDDYPADDVGPASTDREERLRDASAPMTVGLLPGSRRQEIDSLAPLLARTLEQLKRRRPDRTFRGVVSLAPGVDPAWMGPLTSLGCVVSRDPLPDLLRGLDLAVVCSGTASLEAALAGVPHALVYRTSPVNYALARMLVKVDAIGLSNLVSGRSMVIEHVQGDAAPGPVADDLLRWLNGTIRRRRFAEHVSDLRRRLGPPGFWSRTADSILELLTENDVDA